MPSAALLSRHLISVEIKSLLPVAVSTGALLQPNRATEGKSVQGETDFSLPQPVKNQLITRVGWNEVSIGTIEDLIDRSGEGAERSDAIIFVFAFNPVRDGLRDKVAFVNRVHRVICVSGKMLFNREPVIFIIKPSAILWFESTILDGSTSQQTRDRSNIVGRSNIGGRVCRSLFVMFVNERALVLMARPSMLRCCTSSVSRRWWFGLNALCDH